MPHLLPSSCLAHVATDFYKCLACPLATKLGDYLVVMAGCAACHPLF